MSHKDEFLEYWHLTPGTLEAEKAWNEKVQMMEGKRFIETPMYFISQDICYDSPIDGRPITNKFARQEDLARSGCREYDPGMRQDADRNVRSSEERLESLFEKTIDEEISKMPARKKEKLQAELQGGLTAEPIRQSVPQATQVTLER